VASPSFRIRGTVCGLPIAIGSDIEMQANSKNDSDVYAYSPDARIDKDGKFEIRGVLPWIVYIVVGSEW
jgi:hypothetical protein